MGGAAGSAAGAELVVLRDGSRVRVGPLLTGDEEAIEQWFAGLGVETRYARFLRAVDHLDRPTRTRLAQVDHVDHEAIAAVTLEGRTVGIARYIRAGTSPSAEVSVAVDDDWRGLGIAGSLLRRVARRAREEGIVELTAHCLVTNHAIIRLLSRLGPTRIGLPDTGVVEVRIDVTGAP